MNEYIVLSRQVLEGTISDLPETTWKAWIAVLFEGERLNGKVKLPVRSLARWANISIQDAKEALTQLQAPDPDSTSQDHEGRRLLPIPGEENWYMITTWGNHRKERENFFAALRMQRFRKREAAVKGDKVKS